MVLTTIRSGIFSILCMMFLLKITASVSKKLDYSSEVFVLVRDHRWKRGHLLS